jgi:hypothetical protein
VNVRQKPENVYVFDVGRIVKQSLTKKSRTDLGRSMVGMCTLTGWQGTTLNPDMADPDKLVIATTQFGKILAQDDPDALYAELIRLSAVTMGWAQGIERRAKRDRKRLAQAAKKARRKAKRSAENAEKNKKKSDDQS